eukprot:ANDGO_03484.mRNA.1 Fimbrin
MAHSNFTEDELSTLRSHFEAFDADHSGSISTAELRSALEATLGTNHTAEELKAIISSVDADGNNEIDWNEFLAAATELKSSSTSKKTAFAEVYKRAAQAINKIQGQGGAQHSYTEEEKRAFVEHINFVLGNDADLKSVLPIDESSKSGVFDACKDGVLLCKLINASVPDTIDERVINKKANKNAWQVHENLTLCLRSAIGIGCKVVNIGPEDIIEGRVHLVLGLLWQIIKTGLLGEINLMKHPELVRLLKDGEDLADLLKMPPEQLLLRWVNYHLERAGWARRVSNFSGDIKDAENYAVLLSAIAPHQCDRSPLQVADVTQRAEKVLENAERINCRKFVTAKDIVSGNGKLNLAFVANLFNSHPALEPITAEEEKMYAEMLDFDTAGTREERAFRLWMQSLGIEVNNLFEDVRDGIILLQLFDKIEPGIVSWKQVNMTCKNKFKKVENCNYVVVLGKQLKFSMVNIGGTDVVDGNKKLVLGLVWQMMRHDLMRMLKQIGGGKEVTDADLIKWANDTVSQHSAIKKGSSMASFKDSTLSNGIFLCELCSAVESRAVDAEMVTKGEEQKDKELNAKYAISVARKIGATLFTQWEDLVEVNSKMVMTFVASLKLVQQRKKQ